MPDAPLRAARATTIPDDDRPTWPAVWRGFRRRCPNCGTGAMFESYLKVRPVCGTCGERLGGHRADDGPAYLTILVVGHILAPLMHVTFTTLRPAPWLFATIFMGSALVLALWLLPRLKGVVVGIQWARRMHGFGAEPDAG